MAEALRRYRSRLRDSDRERELTGLTVQVPRPTLSPFRGAEKESAELQQRLNAAVGGECQFVLVSGEPGIGKTRLIDELEKLAKVRQTMVLHGRFVEQDRSLPYQGFCELIQEYFRQAEAGRSGSSEATPPPDLSDLAAGAGGALPDAERDAGDPPRARGATRASRRRGPRAPKTARRSSSCWRGR